MTKITFYVCLNHNYYPSNIKAKKMKTVLFMFLSFIFLQYNPPPSGSIL